jgi:hypothetical protein
MKLLTAAIFAVLFAASAVLCDATAGLATPQAAAAPAAPASASLP